MLVPFMSNEHKGTQKHVTEGGQVLFSDLLGVKRCRAADKPSALTIYVSCDPRVTSRSLSDWEKIRVLLCDMFKSRVTESHNSYSKAST